MKAIYRGILYTVIKDDADGVTLEHGALRSYVRYGDPDVIFDPTDGELMDAGLLSPPPNPAPDLPPPATEASHFL